MIQKSKDKLILLGHLHVGQTPLANRGIKRLLFALIVIVSAVLPLKAKETFSYTYEGTTLNYEVSSENTCIIVPGNENISGNIVIPSIAKYDDKEYSVTEIGENAFRNCIELASVTIPNSVTQIRDGVFSGCANLVSLTIPNSVDLIGDAFYECNKLKELVIEDGDTTLVLSDARRKDKYENYIFVSIFYDCPLYSVHVGRNIKEVFYDGLNKRDIPTFQNQGHLKNLTIGSSVTKINWKMFEGCVSLESIIIPNSVTIIESEAFSNCFNLQSVDLSNSIKDIYRETFSNCQNLTSISIPNSVKTIGTDAFFNCKNLTTLTIPSSVTTIENNAFTRSGIKKIIFEDGIEELNLGYNVSFVYDNFKHHNAGLFFYVPLESVYLGRNIIYKTTIINNGGKSENVSPFKLCGRLNDVTIGNFVTSIPPFAFDSCRDLVSVIIPNSVISIDKCAFYCCEKLNDFTISDSVTSIGSSAFAGCTNLSSVSIPNSVTSIGSSAFANCTSLSSVTIPSSITSINNEVFYNCRNLSDLIIPSSVTSIGDYAFAWCNISMVNIPDFVTSIGKGAFYYCELETVIIPASVSSIKRYAFYVDGTIRPFPLNIYYSADEPIYGEDIIFQEECYKRSTLHLSEKGLSSLIDYPREPWSKFHKIEIYDFLCNSEISSELNTEKPYEVYDLNGLKVSDSKENLPKGIYILQQGNTTKKITVM